MIGVGSRPWLQKIAALTVAIALTIATADTFEVARNQYYTGYMDAGALRVAVLGSLEIRVTRVISDVFVWLAQVQTLIRLFPRHKEKVLIKWIGFALIIFDSTFSCLNAFYVSGNITRPRSFQDAIPALSYLFELALGLLYGAWVIYYAVTKRRYSFYHSKMRNICLIALLSLVAILTPVVFFVTDVCNQDVAGWGDYFRWVGAAAASVVVWEWVERIEALERDEKKDGILGREIFDGDEMLDLTPSEEAVWHRGGRGRSRQSGTAGDGGGNQSSALEHGLSGVAQRLRGRHQPATQHFPLGRARSSTTDATADLGHSTNKNGHVSFPRRLPKPKPTHQQHPRSTILGGPTPPPHIGSPISRADTTSAASTVYVVRYDNAADVPQPVRRAVDVNGNTPQALTLEDRRLGRDADDGEEDDQKEQSRQNINRGHSRWQSVTNPFKRKRASPPAEVQAAAGDASNVHTLNCSSPRWGRLGALVTDVGDRIRDRPSPHPATITPAVTVIPAQRRGSKVRTSFPPPEPAQQATLASDGPPSGSTTLAAESTHGGPGLTSPPELSSPDLLHPSAAADRTAQPRSRPSSSPFTRSEERVAYTPPPRADDISPEASSSSPTIIPAPRRSPFRG
nr:ph-response regulator protein palh/rim21 [Quercus suber]